MWKHPPEGGKEKGRLHKLINGEETLELGREMNSDIKKEKDEREREEM